jgi:hypothetical protein
LLGADVSAGTPCKDSISKDDCQTTHKITFHGFQPKAERPPDAPITHTIVKLSKKT